MKQIQFLSLALQERIDLADLCTTNKKKINAISDGNWTEIFKF